jgi:folate-binding protein YgfZ
MVTPHASAPLASGSAFADLSSWRKVSVSGADALSWLNDLVSADVSDLAPGRARRSLVLAPTGYIQAEFTVAVAGGLMLLLQDPIQDRSVEGLLSPYVLSSDVELADRTDDLALFALPGRRFSPDTAGTAFFAPSCLSAGVDLLAMVEDRDAVVHSLEKVFTAATADDVERWRVVAGIPRMGVDASGADLPEEAGLADAVSFEKGCYLGQEAVAKARNLGHPRRLVLHVTADASLARDDVVFVANEEAGTITSAAQTNDGFVALARVRWDARRGPFRTAGGADLLPIEERGPAEQPGGSDNPPGEPPRQADLRGDPPAPVPQP